VNYGSIDAMKRSWEISENIAFLALVVDALNEQALNFYLRYGFQKFQNVPMKLYYPIEQIGKLNF
jgi:ribosomal protein S18 acetylase RimI-like enzyme